MSITGFLKKVQNVHPEFALSKKGNELITLAGEAIPVRTDEGRRLYVYDGDMLLTSVELKRMLASAAIRSSAAPALSVPTTKLIADPQSKSVSPLWSVRDRANLSYSISKVSFGQQKKHYDTTVERMSAAVDAWNGCCGVKFTYSGNLDTQGDFSGSLFRVKLADWLPRRVIASSFFPSDSTYRRFVYISLDLFDYGTPEIAGILKHELGHTLGFVHEWTKSGYVEELGADGSYNKTKKLYTPDPQSIMHTPADGTTKTPRDLSDKDKVLAAKFYPKSLVT